MTTNKGLLSKKYPVIFLAWSFFSWIPYFTKGHHPLFWLLSAPATLCLYIERFFRLDNLGGNYYFAFVLSLVMGAFIGVLIGSSRTSVSLKRKKKRAY